MEKRILGGKIEKALQRGILPHFRGADPGFWALLENCPQGIGMTLHLIDQGIDTGAIIAQGTHPQSPYDNEMSLLRKNIQVGVEFLMEQPSNVSIETLVQKKKGNYICTNNVSFITIYNYSC